MVIYLLHNVEEYGIDLFGRLHEFPDAICTVLNLPPYPDCPLPPAFFLAVNIPAVPDWRAHCGLAERNHPLVGLTFYSVIFINALVHLAPLLAGVATPRRANRCRSFSSRVGLGCPRLLR